MTPLRTEWRDRSERKGPLAFCADDAGKRTRRRRGDKILAVVNIAQGARGLKTERSDKENQHV